MSSSSSSSSSFSDTASGSRVLADAELVRYTSHAAERDGGLDLARFDVTREPCASWDAMRRAYPQHPIALALLSVDSRWRKEQTTMLVRDGTPREDVDERLRARLGNSFHRLGFSYLAVPLHTLIERVWSRLGPTDRNLAALVLPDRPVHYYADLDGRFEWALTADAAERCRAEFIAAFAAYFRIRFGREPNLAGMHWERAVHPAKLSLHVHITSEAFATHLDLKEFDRGFQAYLRQQSTPDSFVCRPSAESASHECLLDASVYHRHSLLRLCGNCKPHGPLLVHWPMVGEPALSEVELLWRGLPNLSLPAAPYAYLACPTVQRQLSHQRGVKRTCRGSDVSPQAAAAAIDLATLQRLLVEHLGPEACVRECTRAATRLEGGCHARTAWCVRRSPPYVHQNNRVLFACTPRVLTLRCMHPDCRGTPKQVPLTHDQAQQLFGEHAAEGMADHAVTVADDTDVLAPLPLEPSAELRTCMGDRLTVVDEEKLVGRTAVEAFTQTHMHRLRSVTYLQSQQGTGKTELLLHELKRAARRDPDAWRDRRRESTLWLSIRRTYATSLGQRTKAYEDSHGVDMAFLDYTLVAAADDQLRTHPRVILSLESLMRLVDGGGGAPRFKRIVLDEVEELLTVFHSSTMDGKRRPVWRLLLALLHQAEQVWVADADLDASTGVRFIQEHLAATRSFAFLFNQRQTIVREYVFVAHEADLAEEARQALERDQTLWIACNGKAPVVRLHAWLDGQPDDADADSDGEVSVLRVRLGLQLLTGDSSTADKRRWMTDPSAWRTRALMVTPVIGSGVNFDEEWFDRAFLLVGRRTTSDRQVFQQLNRVRRLRDTRVWVWVSPAPAAPEQQQQQQVWDLARVQAHVCSQLATYPDADVQYTSGNADDPLLRPTLVDADYNAVFLRNVLQFKAAYACMEERLQVRMRQAGGTVVPRHHRPSSTPQRVQRELREHGRQQLAEWARLVATAQAASEHGVYAAHQAVVRQTYALPPALDLTPSFVEGAGTPAALSQYRLLLYAARGGASYLAELVRHRDRDDYLQHALEDHATLVAAQHLLQALGFTSWQRFLSGAEQVTYAEIDARQAQWQTALVQQHLWSAAAADAEAAPRLVRMARAYFKQHFGIGLHRTKKQRNKQPLHTVEVEPWPSSSHPADLPLLEHRWAQVVLACAAS